MTSRANSSRLGVEQCWEDYQNLFLIKTAEARARDLLDESADCVSASFGTTQREAYRQSDGFWSSVDWWIEGYSAGNQARAIIESAIEAPRRDVPCAIGVKGRYAAYVADADANASPEKSVTFWFSALPHDEGEIPMISKESRQAFVDMATFIMEHGSHGLKY